MRTVAYVCSPLRAPTVELVALNIYRAAWWGERLRERGYAPLVPHTMTCGMVPVSTLAWDSHLWLDHVCLPLLGAAGLLFLAPGWTESIGCRAELNNWNGPTINAGRFDSHPADADMPAIYVALACAMMGHPPATDDTGE